VKASKDPRSAVRETELPGPGHGVAAAGGAQLPTDRLDPRPPAAWAVHACAGQAAAGRSRGPLRTMPLFGVTAPIANFAHSGRRRWWLV